MPQNASFRIGLIVTDSIFALFAITAYAETAKPIGVLDELLTRVDVSDDTQGWGREALGATSMRLLTLGSSIRIAQPLGSRVTQGRINRHGFVFSIGNWHTTQAINPTT